MLNTGNKLFLLKACNFLIVFLFLAMAGLLYGDITTFQQAKKITDRTTHLRTQSSEDKLAYSKLFNQIEKEKTDPSDIKYLRPPAILSITAPSKQYIIGEEVSPIFNAKEKLTIEGFAAPKSLVNIIFMPLDISLSSITDAEGTFSLSVEPNILNKGEYQIYTEGILNNSSTGRIRRIDILIVEPISKKSILIYGSIIFLLSSMIMIRIYLGGSVKVAA